MGGADAVLARARADFEKGEYRWVAQAVNNVVFADPDNAEARALQADTLEQLGYQAENGTWRNFYLSAAKELRDGVVEMAAPSTASPDLVRAMTTSMMLDYLGVRLNGPQAAGLACAFDLSISDTGERFLLEVGNGVLNHTRDATVEEPTAAITLTRQALVGIVMGLGDVSRTWSPAVVSRSRAMPRRSPTSWGCSTPSSSGSTSSRPDEPPSGGLRGLKWRSQGQHPPPTWTPPVDGGWTASSTRCTRGASPTRTATGSATSRDSSTTWTISPAEPDSLGVDAIWLSPIYPSPMLDGGYDVMDHTAVDPVFGTLADLDRLIEECHRRRIRVILDLVMNHTSDLHPWFVQSRQSRTGPFADYFLWRDPSGWDRDGRPEPPNNWLSWFGGSAWEWEPRREQFYLHTFLPEQPDVNWRCTALRAEMWSMVRGWLDRGVDGFRLDVFNAFLKAAEMPSNPEIAAGGSIPWDGQEHRHDKDQPELHDLLAEFRRIVDSRPGTATVGELFTSGIEVAVGVLGAAPPRVRLGPPRDGVDGGVLPRGDRCPGGRLVRSLADDRAVQPRSLATRLAVPATRSVVAIGRRPMPWRRPPRRSS